MAAYYTVTSSEQTPGYSSGTNSYYSSTASSPYASSFEPYSDGMSLLPHDIVIDETLCQSTPFHSTTHSEHPSPWHMADPYNSSFATTTLFPDYHHTTPDRRSPVAALSACPSLSPRSSTHASPCPEPPAPMPSPRKRGRPRLTHTHTHDNTPSSPQSTKQATCLPHKQVERKYREGLNMEFERLRRAVPTLPQSVDANVMGTAKPSKGMVLAAAIEYIQRLERERDGAVSEVMVLRGAAGARAGAGRYEAR